MTIQIQTDVLNIATTPGLDRFTNIINTDNTNSGSQAHISITSGGSSAGDPYACVSIDSTRSYCFGIDNSDSDRLKINTNNTTTTNPSGGTNIMYASTAGEFNWPLQPAFFAYLSSTATNKTGNGAVYSLGTDALTEVFDQGSDFNTNGTFTAPVTGIYDLRSQVTITGTTVATTFVLSIVISGTSARTFTNTFSRAALAADQSCQISALAQMTATDTAIVTITVTGEAGDTDDIGGSATAITYFTGKLAC